MMLRTATVRDAADLARVVNDAFIVEAFFKIGDRTNAEQIVELMNGGGEFLVLTGGEPRTANRQPSTQHPEPGTVIGCVYLKVCGERGYFGMLSIDPARQGRGLGQLLIDAVEARARACGCRFMDIHIVNLREELPGYYRRFGYVEQGTLPFSDPDLASRPCHFIVMSKPL
jgi:ribosomal protein S18 acetylase RimI-like enzyme